MKVGDHVECRHTIEWQNEHIRSDQVKGQKLGKKHGIFIGNAAAYMHLDEAYVVEAITGTGGLRLRGFAVAVSPNDVQVSSKPVFR